MTMILSGCTTGTPLDAVIPGEPPVVSGFPAATPARMKSAVVWGNDTRTVNAALLWLQKQGVAVYGPSVLQQTLAKNAARDNLLLIDEASVLAAANEVGAGPVVFSDRVGDSRPPMVSVRAVDTNTGRVLWSGNARFGSSQQMPSNDTLSVLTEEALMGAWGVKPTDD